MNRVDATLTELVRKRGRGRCEYCQFPEAFTTMRFQIDHIIAQKHLGPTEESNLAFSCYYCNAHKGPNIAGIDPVSGELVRLFHPRRDEWKDHFRWDRAWLFGTTPIARATIQVLEINDASAVQLRELLLEEGIPFA